MADNISTGILSGLYEKVYNPDVLSCLANLSNDEVFTPPEIVNKMLDMLPQELFSSPDTKFLDPAVKTGVYLREIAKRLIKGLEAVIPDRQQRIDHIFKNQLYGIAITELTSLLSRRSLYCSKYANSAFSVTHFENSDGNIRFKRIPHSFDKSGRCIFCGASETQYDRGEEREYYAYEWIHTLHPEEIFGMKFDVIISNPPYQLNDGGGTGSSSVPIYHEFVYKSLQLKPRYLSMIIPSRWYAGGKGLDDFRNNMLNSSKISTIVDFANSADCFPGVTIAGGICYFLWGLEYNGECKIINMNAGEEISSSIRKLNEYPVFVRNNIAIQIIRKVNKVTKNYLDMIVHSRNCFNLFSKEIGHNEYKKEDCVLYSLNGKSYITKNEISDRDNLLNKYKKLMKFASRIPVFMYLTDYRESCLKDVITQLEPGLFKKVTGLDTKDFDLLCSLGVFNSSLMNHSIFQFKRYEDASLTYTGIDMHSNDKEIGGWDTAIRKDEYKKLFYNQQESMNAPQPTEATEDIVELKKEVTRSSAVKSVQPSGKSTAASPATPPLVTEKFGIKSPVPKAALPVPDRKHTNTPDFDESSITVGMTVIHKKFGEGKVQSIADKHIYVKFADGQKNFAFPNAFTDGFLHLPK